METELSRPAVAALLDEVAETDLALAASVLRAIGSSAFERPSFERVLGYQAEGMSEEASKVRIEVEPHLLNPNGVLHGGVIFAAMDSSMGSILMNSLPEGESCATIEGKINFLAAVREGTLSIETRIVHRGSRVAVLESRATTDSGKLAATMTATFMIFR